MSLLPDLAFQTRDVEQYTQSLANYLPGGKLFAAKNIPDSNLRSLIRGLAHTLFDANGFIKEFTDDISPLVTRKFLVEWESAVNLPDDCFIEDVDTLSNEQRRINIIAKLSYMAVQTGTSMEELAAWLGYTIIVVPGIEDTSGTTDGLTDTEKRFTIVVNAQLSNEATFPMTFPIFFGNNEAIFLVCVIERVIPSNCQILFNFTG